MAKVKRDDIRQREIAKKEPQSKLRRFLTLLWWVAGGYGLLVFVPQATIYWLDFFNTISPRITVEAKADQASLHNVEFTFKNEGKLALQSVTLDTVLVWYEDGDSRRMIPYAQDEHGAQERVAFRDRYSYLGEIPPHGGTATANLIEGLRQHSEKHGVKMIGICQQLSFQMFPLELAFQVAPYQQTQMGRWLLG